MGNLVMVVDDDAEIREVLSMVIEIEGLDSLPACDGADALAKLRSGAKPRLILVDLMMPEMNGPELLAELRADPSTAQIPVVVLSGDAHASDTARALGASGCLTKPVELEQITSLLRRYA